MIPIDSARWNGFVLGSGAPPEDGDPVPALTIMGQAGISGLGTSPREVQMLDGQNGQIAGRSRALAKEILIGELKARDRATVLDFIAAMDVRPDPGDELPLTMRSLIWPDDIEVRCYVLPEKTELDVTSQQVGMEDWRLRNTRWLAADPTVYSEELHSVARTSAATSQTWTVQNAGTKEAVSARALRFELEAVTTVKSPYFQRGTHKVSFPGLQVQPGQKLHLNEQGHFHIGGLGVDGWARTGADLFEDRPFLLAGGVDNVVLLSAASGTFKATLVWRDQWVA